RNRGQRLPAGSEKTKGVRPLGGISCMSRLFSLTTCEMKAGLSRVVAALCERPLYEFGMDRLTISSPARAHFRAAAPLRVSYFLPCSFPLARSGKVRRKVVEALDRRSCGPPSRKRAFRVCARAAPRPPAFFLRAFVDPSCLRP